MEPGSPEGMNTMPEISEESNSLLGGEEGTHSGIHE